MFGDFVLPIFPEGSLASSVITTVWVGVFVISFFNLRFGWVLSGLVVPGYLAPLIIAKPWSALVIIVEASVTYFLVWLFSEKLSGGTTWSSVFGRDRFMALVLTSIVVRLCFDGWLLPELAGWLGTVYDIGFDWQSNLHSFGLIIISLFANQLWKPGYARGMFNSLVIIGIATLIIRYGLMELTNFRISGVSYLYEGVASSILASPKAYIILVMTAILASRMNLRYGWEFNGILIPALIALQWYQPFRILTSFVEAFVIYGLSGVLLRTRFFADVTMEGARKVLLFFNVSFVYKLVLGHALAASGLEVRIVDYYGFGYLLSTLIAIKMFDKNIAARLSRATLQISFAGAAVGSLIGFVLTLVVPSGGEPVGARARELLRVRAWRGGLESLIGEQTIDAYGRFETGRLRPPTDAERASFRRAVELLAANALTEEAAGHAAAAGYSILRLDAGALALVEAGSGQGRGTFVVAQQGVDIAITVPDPLAAPGLTAAGARLFERQGARALAIAGIDPMRLPREERAGHSFVETFLVALDLPRLILQPGNARTAVATLSGRLGAALNLAALQRATGGLSVTFAGAGETGSLSLAERHIRQLFSDQSALARYEGPLEIAITAAADFARPTATAPAIGELAYLDAEVLRPLLAADARVNLNLAAHAARAAGYQLTLIGPVDRPSDVLLSPARRARDGRGVYVIRLGGAASIAVQAPRAAEEPKAVEGAARLYEALGARMLMIAQTDATRGGKHAIFDAAYRAVLRAAGDAPLLIVQARAMPTRPDGTRPVVDALIAVDRVGAPRPAEKRLADALLLDGRSVGRVTGGALTAGYEVGAIPQALQLAGTRNKSFAVVWLAPHSRAATSALAASRPKVFDELGISTVELSLPVWLNAHPPAAPLPAGLRARLVDYAARRDAVALRDAQITFPSYQLEHVQSPATQAGYIGVLDARGGFAGLLNLAAAPGTEILISGRATGPAIRRFQSGAVAWLLPSDERR